MRSLRGLTVLALAVAAVSLTPLAAVAGTVGNRDDFSPVLPSGHCLAPTGDQPEVRLISTSNRFELFVYDDGQLTLENHVDLGSAGGAGYPTWNPYTPRSMTVGAGLCMTTAGDLVLKKKGKTLWHTRTAGRARGGSAELTNGGRLIVRGRDGSVVWSSRTTAVEMVAGDTLAPGGTLVNRTYPGSTTQLEMRTSGDLVLRRNHTIVWRTKTHVHGSHLTVTGPGHMDVVTPGGRVVWRSTGEGHHAVLTVAQKGRLVFANIASVRRCFVRPIHASHECGEG